MLRNLSAAALSLCILLISACSSTPTRPPAPLPADQTARLKSMTLPSRLPVPVQGIKPKQLKDTWGASRSSGRTHEGIDIMSERGTRVYS